MPCHVGTDPLPGFAVVRDDGWIDVQIFRHDEEPAWSGLTAPDGSHTR